MDSSFSVGKLMVIVVAWQGRMQSINIFVACVIDMSTKKKKNFLLQVLQYCQQQEDIAL